MRRSVKKEQQKVNAHMYKFNREVNEWLELIKITVSE